MRFDKTNFPHYASCLQQLKSDIQDKTIIIGQLDSLQFRTVLNGLALISHIETITFENYDSVDSNLEFITNYIQQKKINYKFLNIEKHQSYDLLAYAYSAQLDALFDEANKTIHIKSAAPLTVTQDQQTPYPKNKSESLHAPPNSPSEVEDDFFYPPESKIDNKRRKSSDAPPTDTFAKKPCYKPAVDLPTSEFNPISALKQLTHSVCGEAANLHRAICNGDEKEVLIAVTTLAEDKRIKLLNTCCLEASMCGASVLKLALRSENIKLIGTLIDLGANPFQLSENNNSLLHNIALDLKPEALNIFLMRVQNEKHLTDFMNLPFCGGDAYNGFYALDVICLETANYLDNYENALLPEKQEETMATLEIIRQLLLNNAQSKLLIDAKFDINSILDLSNIANFTFQDIWPLIESIDALYQNTPLEDPVKDTAPNNTAKLLAQTWLNQGMLPNKITAPQEVDPELTALMEQGLLSAEEAAAQFEILKSCQFSRSTN